MIDMRTACMVETTVGNERQDVNYMMSYDLLNYTQLDLLI